MDAKRAAYDGVQEYLDTIQELKSCSREEEYLEGLEKKLDYVVKCSFRNEIAPGAATTTAQFILRFGLVAVMLVGGILVTAGSLSIPMFILFLLFAGRIYDPFTSCFMLMAEVFSALVSVKRMKQIDATPEQTGTNVCNNKGYDIEFKNVVFSYNEEPVLKGVSFVAKQGEVTALVGPSGSGPSHRPLLWPRSLTCFRSYRCSRSCHGPFEYGVLLALAGRADPTAVRSAVSDVFHGRTRGDAGGPARRGRIEDAGDHGQRPYRHLRPRFQKLLPMFFADLRRPFDVVEAAGEDAGHFGHVFAGYEIARVDRWGNARLNCRK